MLSGKGAREGPLVEIENPKQLEAWLEKQPREVSAAFAARAALRVLPFVHRAKGERDYTRAIVLPVFRATGVAEFWSAVSADATRIEAGKDKRKAASAVAGLPLWPKGETPDALKSLWQEMKAALRAENQDWEVWTEWYDARLEGRRSNKKLEIARATIANNIWGQGPAAVNAEIKRLIENHKRKGRTNKDPKPSPVPEIPPQRPAALEPIWSDGILVLPPMPARTDGDKRANAAALKALRAELIELADDVEAEKSNFDKRAAAYLRHIAERIPNRPPPQHELFRLAHAKEVLQAYNSTVNDQWPEHLAARYHALTLHFDRTVRQFPKWREFVRNADKDRLTADQIAEIPALSHAMADALRDEDAQEFVDPPIPTALENLHVPSFAESEIAAEAQPPAMPMEALLLNEDVVESINNIVKEAVAAALAEARIPKSPSKARAAGPKAPMGIGETARETVSGFKGEATHSIINEGKRLGKATGPAITRWTRRLLFGGSSLAGVHALAPRLIQTFPDKFEWLQAIMAWFS
ncbi:MAG: hypothetical protein ACT4O2_09515 [Beijerinckiaceae bacterium]